MLNEEVCDGADINKVGEPDLDMHSIFLMHLVKSILTIHTLIVLSGVTDYKVG